MNQIDRSTVGPLMRKMQSLGVSSEADMAAIAALPHRIVSVGPAHYLVRESARTTECCLLLEGYACRHKVAANGGRQIVSFHMQGDLLDLQHLMLPTADHNVQTITPATVAWIDKADLRALMHSHPAIAEALWTDTLIDASIFREWVLNVGRRDARSRIAHMLCEFITRCKTAGLGDPERFELPMTQEQIADATGLTPVHVNRMVRALREEGAVTIEKGVLRVTDWRRLKMIGDFDSAYLHSQAA